MDMGPGIGLSTEMSGNIKENSPTSPLYLELHNEISDGVLSGAGNRSGRSLIYHRELSRPMNLQA